MNELLPELILRGLKARRAGRGIIEHAPEMDSTNLRARMLVKDGAPDGSLVVCEHQTAGRGRLGRGWETPRGEALTCSLILAARAAQAQMYTLAAAVAAAKAARTLCPTLEPRIKWPNDLIINGRKCAGILCELCADSVIIGIGINVNQTRFTGELTDKATSLLREAGGEPLDRCELLRLWLGYMEDAAEALEQRGLEGILDEYADMSATIGARVRVTGAAGEFTGTARGMDESGALIVDADDGTERRVLAGDVSVRGIMGYV